MTLNYHIILVVFTLQVLIGFQNQGPTAEEIIITQAEKPTTMEDKIEEYFNSTLEFNTTLQQTVESNLLDMFTKNIDMGAIYPDPNQDLPETSDEDDESVETRRRNHHKRKRISRHLVPTPYQRRWNLTHKAKGKIRTFRYLICDIRYLRNVCQYHIIEILNDVCTKYRCNATVIPIGWEAIKRKCKEFLVVNNPNPVWNGTYYHYRNLHHNSWSVRHHTVYQGWKKP